MKQKTIDAITEISLIILAVAIVAQCSYAITAGLLDRPPELDAVPFNESQSQTAQCNGDTCIIPANVANGCPDDALNCQ